MAPTGILPAAFSGTVTTHPRLKKYMYYREGGVGKFSRGIMWQLVSHLQALSFLQLGQGVQKHPHFPAHAALASWCSQDQSIRVQNILHPAHSSSLSVRESGTDTEGSQSNLRLCLVNYPTLICGCKYHMPSLLTMVVQLRCLLSAE